MSDSNAFDTNTSGVSIIFLYTPCIDLHINLYFFLCRYVLDEGGSVDRPAAGGRYCGGNGGSGIGIYWS